MADILDILKQEHHVVVELCRATEAEIDDPTRRRELFKQLKMMLTAHGQAKTRVVYEQLRKLPAEEGRAQAEEGEVEQNLFTYLLMRMSRSSATLSRQWSALARVLRELIEHHVQNEQVELFPIVRNHFSEFERADLFRSFQRAKPRGSLTPRLAALQTSSWTGERVLNKVGNAIGSRSGMMSEA